MHWRKRKPMNRWIFNRESAGCGSAVRRIVLAPVLLAIILPGALFVGGCQKGEQGPSKVEGVVAVPLAEARIYIYREGEDIYGPSMIISEPTGPDGRFSLSLEPGSYVAVVRKRKSGDVAGPVRIGDYRGQPVPFQVVAGQPVTLDLEATVKASNEKAFPDRIAPGQTAISGTVRDADGTPLQGIRVHVYDHIQMSERPKYVGERTGPDGRYVVPVKRGGTYYLAARDRFGGPPQLGDLYGRYDEGTVDPSGVVVRKGEIADGIDIVVHKVW